MIEAKLRKYYQSILVTPLLDQYWAKKIHPNAVTLFACLTGMAVFPLLTLNHPYFAVAALLFSGFLDTLDGSVARHRSLETPFGAILDIFCDRVVEASVILALFAVDPNLRAFPAFFMLASILLCVTAFLVIGIFANRPSQKGFYYSPGLIERAEAFFFFCLMILIPNDFGLIAYLFSSLVIISSITHIILFKINSK